MSRDNYAVFSGGNISSIETRNRLIRSGTYEGAMTRNGRVTDRMLALYRSLAKGGAGMIVTGIMAVMPQGKSMPHQTCVYDDSFIEDISGVADTVHRWGDGCKVIAQMAHAGRQVFFDNRKAECVGPSAIPCPILKKKPRALSTGEVEHIVRCFADGIERARKAGYDGAQLHAAHGYLLSSFLSPYTNRRDDRYGGRMENRVNIIREIVALARENVGDFPILIKMNCDDNVEGGIDIDTFLPLAKEIEGAGLDAIEVSGGMWDCLIRTEEELGFPPLPLPEAHTHINTADKQSYFLDCARELEVDIPVILVGGNRNIERMEQIMGEGKIDFFSLSRPFITEPDLPRRWLEGEGSNNSRCVSCNACLFDLKLGSLNCVMRKSRLKYRIITGLTPRYWNKVMK